MLINTEPIVKDAVLIKNIKEYLVWIEVGGEQGYWQCEQLDYRICHGNTDEEVLNDWINQINRNIKFEELTLNKVEKDIWTYYGRPIRIFELKKNFLPEDNNWKILKWVKEEPKLNV